MNIQDAKSFNNVEIDSIMFSLVLKAIFHINSMISSVHGTYSCH
jgi:hypothetical protein